MLSGVAVAVVQSEVKVNSFLKLLTFEKLIKTLKKSLAGSK